MAPPSKLTTQQKQEIVAKLAEGASLVSLAREYGVSDMAIHKLKKANHSKQLKTTAMQIVAADRALSKLSPNDQNEARTLAKDLIGVLDNLSEAAHHGAVTSKILKKLAREYAEAIDIRNNPEAIHEQIKTVRALTVTGNEASTDGWNFLKANQEAVNSRAKKDADIEEATVIPVEELTDAQLLQIIHDGK